MKKSELEELKNKLNEAHMLSEEEMKNLIDEVEYTNFESTAFSILLVVIVSVLVLIFN